MRILVLGGGDSPEREVSERSAEAVMAAVRELGHEAVYLDPKGASEAEIVEAAKAAEVVLPILHGAGGEDGSIQRVLDEAGTPYLGAGAVASETCFDKVLLKRLLEQGGILTPRSEVVTAASFARSGLARGPFVLKPIDGGSSLDALIVRKLPYDAMAAERLLRAHDKMLLEELIEGVEITMSVLGDKALPVIEIVPPVGEEFDYEFKYNGATQELCPPRHVSETAQREAQTLAERIHRLAGVRHLSRTDIIVTADERLYVLETNTMPGLTAQSLFPKAAAVAGLSWPQLVARFIELARAG
jgi:D-alanine-D-alanine ligase